MTTTEGWVDVMYSGIDSRGIDLQPKKDANIATIIYFVAFMVMGSQFIINLFVGVVIDNFNTIKEKEELGNMFVTEQ
jgi:voltage-dependent calcium channel L type alpha-1D